MRSLLRIGAVHLPKLLLATQTPRPTARIVVADAAEDQRVLPSTIIEKMLLRCRCRCRCRRRCYDTCNIYTMQMRGGAQEHYEMHKSCLHANFIVVCAENTFRFVFPPSSSQPVCITHTKYARRRRWRLYYSYCYARLGKLIQSVQLICVYVCSGIWNI